METIDNRVLALMSHLGIEDVEEITESYDNCFEAEGGEYLVLTDEEADEAWDEAMDNYIDECILYQLPDHLRCYFNDEAFKRDASFDGKGNMLASYDGEEHEEKISDEWFYIYRVN